VTIGTPDMNSKFLLAIRDLLEWTKKFLFLMI
jgi:hypothetical protein